MASSNQLFKGVSTRFGRRPFEKCFEKTFPNDCSAVQNLRLNMVTKKTSDCSHASRMFVVFCKPILAIWLQRKHQTIINRACLLCFVNTSCGTVVLQRGLDQPVVPGDRGVHGWDSFSASRSYWHELLLQLWNFSVANLFLSRFELGSKLLLVGVSRFWEAERSCLCRRASRSVFAIPNPPARGLHSWRFMPPVCTGAVLVAGSHTLAGE